MDTSLDISSKVKLNDQTLMPLLGLGVYQLSDSQVLNCVQVALDCGYRLIDTASFYQNEAAVGAAVRESSVPRSEIFVTTKVWNADQGYDQTLRAFDQSMKNLGLEYLDLYLVHWPVKEQYLDTWRALETIHQTGRVRSVGVSNFLVEHLERLAQHSDTTPVINQIEFHPHLQQPELFAYCQKHQIQVQAWSPLMQGQVLQLPLFQELAKKYQKNAVQIVLRWNLQRGISVIPKSAKPERVRDNGELFDFEISREDMARIDGLDQHRRIGPDPGNFNF